MIEDLLQRCRFPAPGSEVSCAVSGGADSLALLVLAVAAGCEVTAIHVDHGVRVGSATEADVVADACRRFGTRFEAMSVSVEPGPNLEARLRAARFSVLPNDVLTGHTADDQAETLLLHLLRGSGRAGLAGMRRERHPIIELRRAETHALCASLALQPVQDPSNNDARMRRNRIRHELLPLADDIARRDVSVLLARTASLLRDDEDLLERLSLAIDPSDARAVAGADRPLAVRAVRRWLAPHLGGYVPDLDTVERVLEVARGSCVACDVHGGIRVRRSHQRLVVSGPENDSTR